METPGGIQIIATRPLLHIAVVPADPTWPATFERFAERIRAALGARALSISHVGSTSVPGLAAKPVIDVDLVVADPTDEAAYAPALEQAGFQFLLREPDWHEHRLFGPTDRGANIHVWGPGAPELTRHALFRDWLREHEDDRDRYAQAKLEAAAASDAAKETIAQYNDRKQGVIADILKKIFLVHGPLEEK